MKTVHTIIQKIVIGILAMLLFCNTLHAQFTVPEQLTHYSEKVLQEKLYMHTDRSFYLAGDLLWFKLYNVDASLHRPLSISKLAYVEILDANNAPAVQAKISMQDGKGNGSIYLPVTLQSGHYKLRAYTNWMKNFGADYFFEKRITVVNTQKKREIATKEKQIRPDIQFFPEGGNMVYGITSKLACKVTATDGKGIAYTGSIVDEQNHTVANFRSQEFGMGSFYFTPQSGHTYTAMMNVDKNRITAELPQIYKEGYIMHVSDSTNGTLAVIVKTNIASAGELYLLAHTRQSVKASMKSSMQNGKAVFMLNPDELGDGITHLTVFSSAKQPICERLYFKYPENKLSISVTGNANTYATRTKLGFDIISADRLGRPLIADMSMAVYKVDALQGLDETDINSYLWLTSELKGYIESPGYYFENKTAVVMNDMDNLMLTQGWRRFKWTDVQANKTPAFSYAPEYNGHIITGKLVNNLTAAPITGVETYASAPGMATGFTTCMSDAEGKLWYELPGIKGTTEIIVQTSPTADTIGHIEITNPFSENYSATRLPVFKLFAADEKTLLEQSIATQVQNVYGGENSKRFSSYIDTVPFFEKSDASYFLDNFTRFSTMEEVLREYVASMDVRKRKNTFDLPLLDLTNLAFFGTNPMILVDGVPVFDISKLMLFDPLKMKKLEMVNRRYILGSSYFTGIMNWHTYKGNLAGYELDSHATVIDYEGLQLQREFYAPVYDTPEKIAAHIPDFRSVLYWSPDIQTNKTGKSRVEFFSSDKKGKYVAIIQGLAAGGLCGMGIVEFEVK